MRTIIDKFGRVLIPKAIRRLLGLKPASSVNIINDGKKIIIEPLSSEEAITEKNGLLVYTRKVDTTSQEWLKEQRAKRNKRLYTT